jgi:hypothetical protein
MTKSGSRIALAGVTLFWCGFVLLTGTSSATLPMQKKAKALGFPADNCLYCHTEKMPKKDAVTHNARGQFLVDQKAKKGAKEVDLAWLKDFQESKK